MLRKLVAFMRFDGFGPGTKRTPLKARPSPRVTPLAEAPFAPNPARSSSPHTTCLRNHMASHKSATAPRPSWESTYATWLQPGNKTGGCRSRRVRGSVMTLRFGSLFRRIETFLMKTLGPELSAWVNGENLDAEMRGMFNRTGRLLGAMGWQLCAYTLAANESWLALYLLGHPVAYTTALSLEATAMFIRHLIVIVPAGLG